MRFYKFVQDRFYRIESVQIWTETSNAKTYLTGFKATFGTRGEITGWPDIEIEAKDPNYSYGTSQDFTLNNKLNKQLEICYTLGDEFYVLGIRIKQGDNYVDILSQTDLVEGQGRECTALY